MKKLFPILAFLCLTACNAGDGDFQVVDADAPSGNTEGSGDSASLVQTLAIRPAFSKVTGTNKTLQLTADIFLNDDSVIEDVQKSFSAPGETDAQTIFWETDNFGVATVDENGLVTTHSAGDAFIIATVDGHETSARVIVEAESSNDPNVGISETP